MAQPEALARRTGWNGRNDRIAVVAILFTTYLVFSLSPIHTVYDSRYTMLFSEQLLWRHSFSLDAGAFPDLQSHQPGQIHQRGVDMPYHLLQRGERFYYFFPPGSVVLSMPCVALANATGISLRNQNGIYDDGAEKRLEAIAAAFLMAVFAGIVFCTSRLILPFNWSLLITAATAFGTQVWSTASRAVWAQTWGIFILAFVIWLIVRAETGKARLSPVILATSLAWMYFVRPTYSIAVAAIALYVLVFYRAIFLPLLLTGCGWLGLFIGYSRYHFGQSLPPYYQPGLLRFSPMFWEGLAGNLVSPSRGLLVCVPTIGIVVYLLVRYRRAVRRRLVLLALGVILVHFVAISLFHPWHAGHSYGARLCTDLVPWFSLLAVLGMEARRESRQTTATLDSISRRCAEASFAVVLLACSITFNGIGAFSFRAWEWNYRPTDIDHDTKRLWSWKYPQFLGAYRAAAAQAPPVPAQGVR
jgi:hypothetical protein